MIISTIRLKNAFTSFMLCLFAALNLNAQNKTRIPNYLEKELQKFNIPNLEILIVEDDSITLHKRFGYSAESENMYYIGSSSKSFTALGVLKLIQQERLSLNTRVIDIIPEISFSPSDSLVTIKNLLHHTSGISKRAGFDILPTLNELKNSSFNIQLEFRPGEKHEYSNMNYALLGLVIEKISGMTYCQYMDKEIFNPLEMAHTICDPAEIEFNQVLPQYQYFGPVPFKSSQIGYATTSIPAGFIMTSATDLAHYFEMNLNNGRYGDQQILGPELLEVMHTSWNGSNVGYAMGWKRGEFNGKPFLQHLGSTATSYSGIFILPDDNVGFTILTNSNSLHFTENLMRGVMQIITGKNPQPASRFEYYLRIGVLGILLLLILKLSISIYRLFRGKISINQKKQKKKVAVSSVILIAVILGFPYVANIPFFIFLRVQPDIGSAILVSLVVPVLTALSKLFAQKFKCTQI